MLAEVIPNQTGGQKLVAAVYQIRVEPLNTELTTYPREPITIS